MDTSKQLRGRMGALATHARHDPRETTKNARAAFLSKFEKEADPDGKLPPAERERRARMLRRLYYANLAYQSHKARKTTARLKVKEKRTQQERRSA